MHYHFYIHIKLIDWVEISEIDNADICPTTQEQKG